ncbi:uncharacterized protein [Euphorbia lathyris]|uniref:uncharacterized protein n=1 Tax=Euphorbia lathyris TaxID=212925 RepID=UPI00331443F2
MVKALEIYMSALQGLLKLSGMKPQQVEIEPGTIIHFWRPNQTTKPKPKPAVVFLHGFGSNGIQQWQFQVLSLATTYSVYVPSLLFFGDSTTDKTERSPEFQAECIAKSLKKLGVEKCVLVGLSYGGIVGFKMAEMYPDLVESMVVSGSYLAMTETYTCGLLKRIGFSSLSQLLIPYTLQDVKTTFHTLTYKLPWLPNMFFTSVLEKFHLLWGENDEIFPMKIARDLEKKLTGKACLHYIEKAGHLVHLERPFAFNKQLKKILSSICKNGHKY